MELYETPAQTDDLVRINSNSADLVVSFWPGYVFQSGRPYLPGLEDNFSSRITTKVSSGLRTRYHLVSPGEVTRSISSASAAVLVLPPQSGCRNITTTFQTLRSVVFCERLMQTTY